MIALLCVCVFVCFVCDRFQADDGKGKVKFVYPGGTTALESNAHPKKPTSYRLEEISKVSSALRYSHWGRIGVGRR